MAGRILIADDVATNRIILKVRLGAASYEVLQATSEAELFEITAAQPPDMIILDGGFQGDRGIDICQELSEKPKTAAIPVLIIAADYSPADRLAALLAGASDVVEKSLEDNGLLARVRNILRERGIEEELLLRESTAIELGFQEKAAPFQRRARLLLVNGSDTGLGDWQRLFRSENSCDIHRVGHGQLLETISHRKWSPDLIVIPARKNGQSDCLHLLAELRSRPSTRHGAIMVVNETNCDDTTISALDMGANDVVPGNIPAAEFSFRLTRLLRRKYKAEQLRDTLKDGLRMAVTDPLTGLFNRRYALPHLARIAQKASDTGNPYAVMVLDLDHFKRINDTYGHGAGDSVLVEVARRLKANVRSVDLIARIGGEEFLVVMPETDLASARAAAERLRRVTEQSSVALPAGQDAIAVTASIGVSIGGLDGDAIATVEAMVERADQALLGAKSTGRNQVIIDRSAA